MSHEFILQPKTTGHCSLEVPLQSLLVRIVRSRSQNDGVVEAGQNLWRPCGPSATSKQGPLETAAKACDQVAFDTSKGGGSSASLVSSWALSRAHSKGQCGALLAQGKRHRPTQSHRVGLVRIRQLCRFTVCCICSLFTEGFGSARGLVPIFGSFVGSN